MLGRVSVIHRLLTWTTAGIFNVGTFSLLCMRTHTRGLGTPTASENNIFDSEKLSQMFLVLQTGFEPRVSLDAIDYSIYPMSCTLTFHVCRGTQCLLISVLVSLSNSYRYKRHWTHAGPSLCGQFDRLSTSIAYRIQNTEYRIKFAFRLHTI